MCFSEKKKGERDRKDKLLGSWGRNIECTGMVLFVRMKRIERLITSYCRDVKSEKNSGFQ